MSVSPDIAARSVGVRSFASHAAYLAVSGVLLAVCFAPIGWWAAGYVALSPVGVVCARSVRGGRLFFAAWVVFALWWAIMARWIVSVHWLAVVSIAGVCGLYAAGSCWVLWWLVRRYRGAMTLLLPMAWISGEYLRGLFPFGGFAWLSLGHSQAAMEAGRSPGWVVQTADLFGEQTVGFIVAMSSGLIADLLTRPLLRAGERGIARVRRTIRAAVVVWAMALIAALGYGRSRVMDGSPAAGLTVAVVQTDVPQDNKIHRTAAQDAEDFTAMMRLSQEAGSTSPRPQVIVWPETMVPAPLNEEAVAMWVNAATYHAEVSAVAEQLGVPLLVGAPFWSDPTEEGVPLRRANSAFLYDAAGRRFAQRYDKQHLVPMGEYLPVVRDIGWLKRFYLEYVSPYPYDYSLQAGTRRTVFELRGAGGRPVRIVTPICYEDAVGRVARRLMYDERGDRRADVMVNLTNSAWYVGGGMTRQHLQIAVLRAIENRAPVARAVNGGISGFIDSVGRIGPIVERGEAVATATLNIDSRSTLYGRVGTLPIAGLTIATALLTVGGWWRRRTRKG